MSVQYKIPGSTAKLQKEITPAEATRWKYRHESDEIGGGFAKGAEFTVVDSSKPGDPAAWIRLAIPGSYPRRVIKLSAFEYTGYFGY